MSPVYSRLFLRTLEIDFVHKHRHFPSSLTALPIIADIYAGMDLEHDHFILSKGHACAAHYAVLEAYGYHPDVSKVHPDRDPANGIEITSGSLGHGLPIAVGLALGKRLSGAPGCVHVLIGDGEALEGTTWEALHTAARFELWDILHVHFDANGKSGCGPVANPQISAAMFGLFPIYEYTPDPATAIIPAPFRDHPEWIVHEITAAEYAAASAELKGAQAFLPATP